MSGRLTRPRLDPITSRRFIGAAVATVWLLVLACIALVLVTDELVSDAGRPDLTQGLTEGFMYVLAMLSALVVGSALTIRRPRHPVGWLFLLLGALQAVGPAMTGYAAYGAVARPGSLPFAAVVAVVADSAYLLWFVAIALVFHLTPDGRPLSPAWGRLAWATVISGVVAIGSAFVTKANLDPPLAEIETPVPLTGVADELDAVRVAAGIATGLGVLVGALSLLVRFRRAAGRERRQLLWLAPAAVLIPVLVAAAFVTSYLDYQAVLDVVGGLFLILLPVATGLAITRYHLFDVDRILSRALTYALLSAVLAAVYVVVVVAAGAAVGESQLSAVVATLAAVSVAGAARRRLQDAVDRRFNRRRFEAVRMVREHVHDPAPDVTIDDVLRRALGDPDLRVAYWVEGRGEWVTGDGRPTVAGDDDVRLSGPDQPIASIGGAPGTPRELLHAVVAAARPELDNAGLRAAVALQLVEVRESRARIVSAADASRREIERNLHDGAQQRLVALEVKLGLARRLASGGTAVLLDELRTDVHETLTELRDLAHGIYPPLLREHGLGEALRSAAGRAARPTTVDVATERRFEPGAEAAVYFCCLEAMQNAGKHAGVGASVTVRVAEAADGGLEFEVCDDGAGFDPAATGESHGFVNMRDRLGALGGRLTVESGPGRGTVVHGTLPV
ncbi:hypothetical protein E1262_04280 [Jiangella aurantiaca]|uniref:histidine kinase n=1 Tax=Jiangella aurantiaca TaxID=2530373 RepID=A0A4R5AHK0_9ACTN|nr:ATP-binding protein [Jiangella aurantiaca]TDD71951.1 hypothetical protein E1262_04280 [Jiangella aurantiaca]